MVGVKSSKCESCWMVTEIVLVFRYLGNNLDEKRTNNKECSGKLVVVGRGQEQTNLW